MALIGIIVLAQVIGAGALGHHIGFERGRAGVGLALGVCFSVLGLLVLVLLPPTPEAQVSRERALAARRRAANSSGAHDTLVDEELTPDERWLADPLGRYDQRLWNGTAWTRFVRNGSTHTQDDDPRLADLPSIN